MSRFHSPGRRNEGFGTIEILIAIVCFLMAAIPIVHIFTFNIESTKVIHARVITHTAVREILMQMVLMPVDQLADGEFDFSNESRSLMLAAPDTRTSLRFSAIPPEFTRKLKVRKISTECVLVTVSVSSGKQPQADFEASQTISNCRGGR